MDDWPRTAAALPLRRVTNSKGASGLVQNCTQRPQSNIFISYQREKETLRPESFIWLPLHNISDTFGDEGNDVGTVPLRTCFIMM